MSDGKLDEAKGRLKEAGGDLTDDKELKNEGKSIAPQDRSRTLLTTSPTRPRTS